MAPRTAIALAAILLTGALPLAALGADGDEDLELELMPIKAGTFRMGSPDDEYGARLDEYQHEVTISRPFYLGAHEITQQQWRAVMGNNPSYLYDCPTCPVEGLTWYDAIAFCNALSASVGLAPVYAVADSTVTWDQDVDGFRLPTEAEWEYACRAGATTPFSTGGCLDAKVANYCGYDPHQNCPQGVWRDQSLPVGSFPPNAWGLHEMHGNVAEWCWDRYRDYDRAPALDPIGPATGDQRVIRGGSFRDLQRDCRAAARESCSPGARQLRVGLRLARSVFDRGRE